MKSILFSLLLAAAVSILSEAGPIRQSKRDPPTRLVRFEMGALITGSGKLRVNVDKQLGGLVYIQLIDRTGYVFFSHTIYADEEFARLNLDLSRLSAKEYTLKVSNGLEMITRSLKIDVIKPVEQTRSITLQ